MKKYVVFLIFWVTLTGQVLAQSNQQGDVATPSEQADMATGILFGCSFSGSFNCILEQIQKGADVNATLDQTPLMIVSGLGYIRMVRAYIEAGADINAVTRTGWTSLTYAVNENRPDVIRLLLQHGAEQDILNEFQLEKMHRLLEDNP